MKYWKIFSIMLLAIGMASCTESDDTPEEFPDWQNTNEQAFLKVYDEAMAKIAAGDSTWMVVLSCLESTNGEPTYTPEEYIVMQRLQKGKGKIAPCYTDTVEIHYAGWLQPSTRYKAGLTFDSSYYGKYDPDVSSPYKGCVSSFIQGFSTALQYMHRGDAYRVYIPYQLGYGSSAQSSIPAYSMLTFEVMLEDFWHVKEGDRDDEVIIE